MTEQPDEVAFPELDDEQLAIVAALGERRRVHAGEVPRSPEELSKRSWRARPTRPGESGREGSERRPRRLPRTPRFKSSSQTSASSGRAAAAYWRTLEVDLSEDSVRITGRCALRRVNGTTRAQVDAEAHPEVATLLDSLGVTAAELPIAITAQGILRRATPGELAFQLGLTVDALPERCYDVVVVGAGPAGLAASVYAASEGLRTPNPQAINPTMGAVSGER